MALSTNTKRSIRTGIQTTIGVLVALPLIVQASGISETAPGVGTALAVSGVVARIMAIPAVQRRLPA